MGKTILIDARTGSDFTMDAVWAGLVHYLGWDQVIDWPPADKHREGIPQITGDVDRDYGAERRSLCYTPYHKSFPRYTLNGINDLIKAGQIDRIFVDEREESFSWYLRTLAMYFKVPVVVIAGHDKFWNESPEKVISNYGKNFEAMFLDNWRLNYQSLKKTYRMNYATNFDHLWDHENREKYLQDKIYDICFMGYNSHGNRGTYIDHLVKKYGTDGNCLFVEKRPNTVECFLPKREYFRKMAQSKICINLRGAAECGKALRYFEIPYVGSYMLSENFDQYSPRSYYAGIEAEYFSSIEELDRRIEWALNHPHDRELIAARGHKKAMWQDTAKARVEYIYEHLGR